MILISILNMAKKNFLPRLRFEWCTPALEQPFQSYGTPHGWIYFSVKPLLVLGFYGIRVRK